MARTDRLGKTATTVRQEGGSTIVRYHKTDVVVFDEKTITLRMGGWKTATTKQRMNQSASQFSLGYYVFQTKKEWFVDYNGRTIPFSGDTLTLER